MRLGICYFALCRTEDAAEALRSAISIKPTHASYHYLLANVYEALGSDMHAAIHFERAGELNDFDQDRVDRVRRRSHVTAPLSTADEWAP